MTATRTTAEVRPTPFRTRTRDEVAVLEDALHGLALRAAAEIESITIGDCDADTGEILAACTELRAVSELLEDLREHAASSRRWPVKAKKKKAKAKVG